MQPDFHAHPSVIFGKEKPCARIENRDGLTAVQEQQGCSDGSSFAGLSFSNTSLRVVLQFVRREAAACLLRWICFGLRDTRSVHGQRMTSKRRDIAGILSPTQRLEQMNSNMKHFTGVFFFSIRIFHSRKMDVQQIKIKNLLCLLYVSEKVHQNATFRRSALRDVTKGTDGTLR